jgi:hypothetical protein
MFAQAGPKNSRGSSTKAAMLRRRLKVSAGTAATEGCNTGDSLSPGGGREGGPWAGRTPGRQPLSLLPTAELPAACGWMSMGCCSCLDAASSNFRGETATPGRELECGCFYAHAAHPLCTVLPSCTF